jgi:carbon-monoxide dehydrogenase medium subunit
MYPASFEYHRPASVGEAVRLLGEHEGAKVLAGGHSLLPMMKLRLAHPPALIDIGRIADLKGIHRKGDATHIGALTTHTELASSVELKTHCPLISEAAAKIADPAVRNKGTIGGNIAHADPASDLPAVLVALGARIVLTGRSERTVAAKDFFVGLLTTDVREDEILTRVEVPDVHGKGGPTGTAYLKVEHPASGYAVCGAAAVVSKNADGTCAAARLCFNGVTATPYDAEGLAKDLVGQPLNDSVIDQAVLDHVHIDDPLSDVHASGLYRMELAKVYGKRALKAARDRARG